MTALEAIRKQAEERVAEHVASARAAGRELAPATVEAMVIAEERRLQARAERPATRSSGEGDSRKLRESGVMTTAATLLRGVPKPVQFASREEQLADRRALEDELRATLVAEGEGCEECGGGRFVRVTSDRSDPRFGKVKPCACVLKPLPTENLLDLAGLPKQMREWTLDTFPAMYPGKVEGHAAALRFVDAVLAGQQANLLLVGPPGTGKTGLAAAIVHTLADRGVRSRFSSVTDLLWGIRSRFNRDGTFLTNTDGELSKADAPTYELAHVQSPVLVLDDLMKANASDWVQENIFRWVDQRLHEGRSTVITLNESSAEVAHAFGGAVVSRLQMFQRVAVTGDDLRAPDLEVRG